MVDAGGPQVLVDREHLLRKPAGEFFENRKKQMASGLERAKEAQAGANARMDEIEQRLASMSADIAALRAEAEREAAAERDVVDQSMQNGTPLRVSLGQSIADVEAAMGKPRDIADLGSKKIYVYRDLKITFVNGKVTDVQ